MNKALVLIISLGLVACVSDSDTYTLYRSGVNQPDNRFHVATFDATDGNEYNNGNCKIAQDLFQSQPGVTVRFWCEKGRFKK